MRHIRHRPAARDSDPQRRLEQSQRELQAALAQMRAAWADVKAVLRGKHSTSAQRVEWQQYNAAVAKEAAEAAAEGRAIGRDLRPLLAEHGIALLFAPITLTFGLAFGLAGLWLLVESGTERTPDHGPV